MHAAQRNRILGALKSFSTIQSFWFTTFKSYWTCSTPWSCCLEPLGKAQDSQPVANFEILDYKVPLHSLWKKQFLVNYWALVAGGFIKKIIKLFWELKCPLLLGLCQIIIPTGKGMCKRRSLLNEMTYVIIYYRGHWKCPLHTWTGGWALR